MLAIRIDRLSKTYQIDPAVAASTYSTLREEIVRLFKRDAARHRDKLTIWAVRDVSASIDAGEVVGIIGRNGAGKSTLLKLIARITEPTAGRAEVYGRIGTLLEVGTGFHPELTGRENVFLSGAVLGLRRVEIVRKLDAIFDFAGVATFADTPVKRYSSGMFMRLAFAVAAHLEPEILIVDEVLAVGDAEFQKKCLAKMHDVSQSGRTVLFVSHNMAAVQQLCTRGIVLEKGSVAFDGHVETAVQHYLELTHADAAASLHEREDRRGDGRLRFTRVRFFDGEGNPLAVALSGRELRIRFDYEAKEQIGRAAVNVAFNIRTPEHFLLTNLNTLAAGDAEMFVHQHGYFECQMPRLNLRSGRYGCALFCAINGEIADWLQNAFELNVEDGDFYGTGKLPSRDQGDVLIDHHWRASSTT